MTSSLSYPISSYPTDEQLKSLTEKNKELEAAQDRNAAIQVLVISWEALVFICLVAAKRTQINLQHGWCQYHVLSPVFACVRKKCVVF